MAAIHPPDIGGTDSSAHDAAGDPWTELAQCAAEADRLNEQLVALHQRTRAAVAALGNEGPLELEQVHAAHDLLAAMSRVRLAAVTAQITVVPLAQRTEVRVYDAQKTARRWFAHHAGLTNADANALVRAANAAHHYDQVDEALSQAEIAPAHADLIWGIIPSHWHGQRLDDAIETIRDAQELIVTQARKLSVNDFREFCDRVRHLLDTDGPADPSAEPSRLQLTRTFEGRWLLRGDLTPDDGALIATLIESHIERTRRAHHDTNTSDTTSTGEAAAPDEPKRPHSELAADALGQLLNAGASIGRPGRIGLYLHLELADLLNGRRQIDDLVETSGRPHTELGIDIDDDTLWMLMCGGDITPVLNLDGTPLSYGRTRRLAPEVLAHILRHRDRTCAFPTCDTPPLRLRNHHITHWEDHGTTDPTNLCGVCNANHHDHHTRGWGIARLPDGTIHITRPDGTTLTAHQRWRRE